MAATGGEGEAQLTSRSTTKDAQLTSRSTTKDNNKTAAASSGGGGGGAHQHRVQLRVYDLSGGKAATFSGLVLGKHIAGVWHSGIHVYGSEYFFGGNIVKMAPSDVEWTYGITPVQTHELGFTSMPKSTFEKYLNSVRDAFSRDTYDLINWNCNNFADLAARYLLNGVGIPQYVLSLPAEVKATVAGSIIIAILKAWRQDPPIDSDDPEHPRFRFINNDDLNKNGSSSARLPQSAGGRDHQNRGTGAALKIGQPPSSDTKNTSSTSATGRSGRGTSATSNGGRHLDGSRKRSASASADDQRVGRSRQRSRSASRRDLTATGASTKRDSSPLPSAAADGDLPDTLPPAMRFEELVQRLQQQQQQRVLAPRSALRSAAATTNPSSNSLFRVPTQSTIRRLSSLCSEASSSSSCATQSIVIRSSSQQSSSSSLRDEDCPPGLSQRQPSLFGLDLSISAAASANHHTASRPPRAASRRFVGRSRAKTSGAVLETTSSGRAPSAAAMVSPELPVDSGTVRPEAEPRLRLTELDRQNHPPASTTGATGVAASTAPRTAMTTTSHYSPQLKSTTFEGPLASDGARHRNHAVPSSSPSLPPATAVTMTGTAENKGSVSSTSISQFMIPQISRNAPGPARLSSQQLAPAATTTATFHGGATSSSNQLTSLTNPPRLDFPSPALSITSSCASGFGDHDNDTVAMATASSSPNQQHQTPTLTSASSSRRKTSRGASSHRRRRSAANRSSSGRRQRSSSRSGRPLSARDSTGAIATEDCTGAAVAGGSGFLLPPPVVLVNAVPGGGAGAAACAEMPYSQPPEGFF